MSMEEEGTFISYSFNSASANLLYSRRLGHRQWLWYVQGWFRW